MGKIVHANCNQKSAVVAIYITDKIHLQSKLVIWDEEDQYIVITGSIPQEDITNVNWYASNNRAPKYLKQILTEPKTEIISNILRVRILQWHSLFFF